MLGTISFLSYYCSWVWDRLICVNKLDENKAMCKLTFNDKQLLSFELIAWENWPPTNIILSTLRYKNICLWDQASKMDGWRDKKELFFLWLLIKKAASYSKGTLFWFFSISGFSACMFADCLITSLGFGTHTVQIHYHPSHYLHIFPLRIIIAFTTTAHVLTSCRPEHTEVIIFWKWSWWASIVCPISNKQDEVGRFPSPPLLSSSKITFPLFLHSATQDTVVFSVLLRNELMLNVETSGCWIVSAFS